MTTIQHPDGTHITVNPTDVTTDGQRSAQTRIIASQRELERLKGELQQTKLLWANDSADYAAMQYELSVEREARTNAQNDRDVLALKLTAYRTLLQRVVDVDEACTGEAYAALIEDVKAALEVQS